MKRISRKLKAGFFIGIIAVGCITLVVLIGMRMFRDNREKLATAINANTTMSLDNVQHTATRDGVKEWSLEAKSAELMDAGRQAVFNSVSVVFFLKDGSRVYMTAEKGYLRTDTNDLEISGRVVVKNDTYKMETEKLQYRHNSRIVSTDEFIEISGKLMAFEADSMQFDMKTSKMLLDGKVKGTISGNFYN